MATLTPSIYINDDEVDLKLIYVYSNKNGKSRKYTISAAERLGLIKIESGSFLLGRDRSGRIGQKPRIFDRVKMPSHPI